jgi:hypothetical protein
VAKDPVTFNLDIPPVYISVETPSDCIDVEIPPGVAVFIEHESPTWPIYMKSSHA